MNPLQIYIQTLRSGEEPALTAEQLQWIAARYPFFTLPLAECAERAEMTEEERGALLARVALSSADREMLFRLTDADGKKMSQFYPEEESDATPTTDVAIDTFLDTYGRIDPKEEALLEKLIFNPVPADYASVLVKEEEERGEERNEEELSGQDALLDAFLNSQAAVHDRKVNEPQPEEAEEKPAQEKKQHSAPPTTPAPPRDSSLRESLSKIYIRQRRYDKAYEIIYQLSLNFPEKSVYFADQLRFLRKLIENQRHLNNKK